MTCRWPIRTSYLDLIKFWTIRIRLVDVKNEKNKGNGFLAGVSLSPSSRVPRVSLAPKTPFPKAPFPFPFKRLPRRLLFLCRGWDRILSISVYCIPTRDTLITTTTTLLTLSSTWRFQYQNSQYNDKCSLCTDVPPPSEKIGRRDVCEIKSPSLIKRHLNKYSLAS